MPASAPFDHIGIRLPGKDSISVPWASLQERTVTVRSGKEVFTSLVDEKKLQQEIETRRKFINSDNIIIGTASTLIAPIFISMGIFGITGIHPDTETILAISGSAVLVSFSVSGGWFGRQIFRLKKARQFVKQLAELQEQELFSWMKNRYGILITFSSRLRVTERMLAGHETYIPFDDTGGKKHFLGKDAQGWRVIDQSQSNYKGTGFIAINYVEPPVITSSDVKQLPVKTEAALPVSVQKQPANTGTSPSVNSLKASETTLPQNVITVQSRFEKLVEKLSTIPLNLEQKHVLTRALTDAQEAAGIFRNLLQVRSENPEGTAQLVNVLNGLTAELEKVQQDVAAGFEDLLKAQSAYVDSRSPIPAIKIPTE